MTSTLLRPVRHLDLRVEGRVTAASAACFLQPLQEALAAGQPFTALYDRRALSAPTAEGRALLRPFLERWAELAPLVVAWADVYDARRCASLRRAAAARAARGEAPHDPGYPYGLFDDVEAARAWLAEAGAAAEGGRASLVLP